MEQQTIKCAFCKGTGKNPHFTGTCPVCKGKKENLVTGRYMTCSDCRGSGQKGGTTLTCYGCAGLGVIPDTREELRRARKEIRKIHEEMDEERAQLVGSQSSAPLSESLKFGKVGRKASRRKQRVRELTKEDIEEDLQMTQEGEHIRFCQSCAKPIKGDDLVKVCLECFKKIKQGSL